MRHLILLFIALSSATVAAANELVVGEPGSVEITLPNQPNNQRCNIEVKFADGSSQDIEVDPTNPSASVSFTPTIAGTQVIQWDGKMKWRGLKSRPPCEGDGNISVTVRERAEILAERAAEAERLRIEAEWVKALRAAEAERLRAQQAAETERLKLEAERLKAERETRAELERNRRAITNLVTQLDTGGKKLCAFEYVRTKSVNPEQYENTGAIQWLDKLIGSRIVSAKMISEVESAVSVCNQFFSKERRWGSQTFEPPPGDISCTLGSGAKSTCYWTYRIYANDAWQNATAMQAMQAHITSGEKFWATSLPEKPDAKARREKCELNVLSDEGCPGYAEAIARKEQEAKLKAEEEARLARCGTEPLISTKCPGYKEAKAKQDAELARQRAEEEKRKEEKLARQRAEEQKRKEEKLARQRAEEENERKRIAEEKKLANNPAIKVTLTKSESPINTNCKIYYQGFNDTKISFTSLQLTFASYENGYVSDTGSFYYQGFIPGKSISQYIYVDSACTNIEKIEIESVGLVEVNGKWVSDEVEKQKILNLVKAESVLPIPLQKQGDKTPKASEPRAKLSVAENDFEALMNPEKGTRKMWLTFIDNGGLNTLSNFHGIEIDGVDISYSEGKIESWTMIASRSYSPKQVREAMSKVCGASDSDWKREDLTGRVMGSLEKANVKCRYLSDGTRSWELMLITQ